MPLYKHWDILIKPALDCIELHHIVEIGADSGENTKKILEYCRQRSARLTTIDCVPSSEVLALLDKHRDIFTLIDTTSLEALPKLSGYDAILIDGDHNWYTVYHELKAVEDTFIGADTFPLVFFHDVAWPYGRRDMYYAPERIPDKFCHEYGKKGMIPGQSNLMEEFGVNAILCNALHEGGDRNGVLTAIEDFIKDSKSTSYHFTSFNAYHGLGVILSQETIKRFPKLAEITDCITCSAEIGNDMQNMLFDTIRLLLNINEKENLLSKLTRENDSINKEIKKIRNSRSYHTMLLLKRIARLTGILALLRFGLRIKGKMLNRRKVRVPSF